MRHQGRQRLSGVADLGHRGVCRGQCTLRVQGPGKGAPDLRPRLLLFPKGVNSSILQLCKNSMFQSVLNVCEGLLSVFFALGTVLDFSVLSLHPATVALLSGS